MERTEKGFGVVDYNEHATKKPDIIVASHPTQLHTTHTQVQALSLGGRHTVQHFHLLRVTRNGVVSCNLQYKAGRKNFKTLSALSSIKSYYKMGYVSC